MVTSIGRNADRIADIIRKTTTAAELASGPLLFHGTLAKVDGALRPGGDGVFWTADSSTVAQSYIPAAGVSAIVPQCLDWELGSRFPPSAGDDLLTRVACQLAGCTIEDLRIETDSVGRTTSYRIVDGWPCYRDVMEHLASLGYSFERGWAEVKLRREEIMPASWSELGSLVILHIPEIDVVDISGGREGDLLEPQHLALSRFDEARACDADAIAISDFLQSKTLGNVGHRAIGLLPRALERAEWLVIPARRFEFDGVDELSETITSELAQLWEDLRVEPALRP
ncbi:hypothetical protein [Amorphus sp. 3PC139-8]|uniref:hypothetical protein n=1 Tax=Amorphus sp. 3PC139-8 TaxID=2735676 RepID=UPI00345C8597